MQPTFTLEEYRLAGDAGWSHAIGASPREQERARVRCRLELARAIHALEHDPDVYAYWTRDPDPIEPSDDAWIVELVYGASETPVECLGSVELTGGPMRDPYARIVGGELYMELEARREACIIRGES